MWTPTRFVRNANERIAIVPGTLSIGIGLAEQMMQNRRVDYDQIAPTYDQRFLVPIQYEDRKNSEVLYRFAANWVEMDT